MGLRREVGTVYIGDKFYGGFKWVSLETCGNWHGFVMTFMMKGVKALLILDFYD